MSEQVNFSEKFLAFKPTLMADWIMTRLLYRKKASESIAALTMHLNGNSFCISVNHVTLEKAHFFTFEQLMAASLVWVREKSYEGSFGEALMEMEDFLKHHGYLAEIVFDQIKGGNPFVCEATYEINCDPGRTFL